MDLKRGACALGFAALAACTSEQGTLDLGMLEAGPVAPIDTPSKDAGRDASGDAGPSSGPIVSVMSPAASSDPLTGPVLKGPTVEVQCAATQRPGGEPINPTKVSVSVFAGDDAAPTSTVPANSQGSSVYRATVAVDAVPTGKVRFRCVAIDTTVGEPLEGAAEIAALYDAGPVITFTNLNENSAVARGTNDAVDLTIQFKLEPSRLSPSDKGADVAEVRLGISERDEIVLPISADGTYAQEVDFKTLFNSAPIEAATILVTATNKRAGQPAVRKKQLVIKVDGEGPVVTFTAPQSPNGQAPIVGGSVLMQMKITDALAGVAMGASKVYARIDTKSYLVTAGPDSTYSFIDPLGDSPIDGEVVAESPRFRALVWERGIRVNGSREIWMAGTDAEHVFFYSQADKTVPLVIDTDGDGVCDAINNAIELGAKGPYVTVLGPGPCGPAPESRAPRESQRRCAVTPFRGNTGAEYRACADSNRPRSG